MNAARSKQEKSLCSGSSSITPDMHFINSHTKLNGTEYRGLETCLKTCFKPLRHCVINSGNGMFKQIETSVYGSVTNKSKYILKI